jgi:hypothetical protein
VTHKSASDTPVIHAVNKHGGHVRLHNAIVTIECESTIQGAVTTHGSGVTASAHVSQFLFFNCTTEWVVHTNSAGSLTIRYTEGNNGTLTSTGAKITATRAGLSCIYETKETHLGTVTGEKGPNGEATLDINGPIPRTGGSFLCGGSTAQLTGSYTTTHTLKVEA